MRPPDLEVLDAMRPLDTEVLGQFVPGPHSVASTEKALIFTRYEMTLPPSLVLHRSTTLHRSGGAEGRLGYHRLIGTLF